MVLYFAYGSNMLGSEMERLCEECGKECDTPAYSFETVSKLSDFEVRFNRCSFKRNRGVADVVRCKGAGVEGVVYRVPEKCMCALRVKEGYPTAYDEVSFEVMTRKGKELRVLSYVVKKKWGNFIPPDQEYKDLIVKGAKAHDLSGDYITKVLASIETGTEDCWNRYRVTRAKVGPIVRSCIDKVTRDIKCNPWSFRSEPDVHALLYYYLKESLEEIDVLYSKPRDGNRIILLYREFPTKHKYAWKTKQKRRANFDLAVLSKARVDKMDLPSSREDFPELPVEIVIEIKLDVTDRRWKDEMKKCLTKLKEIKRPEHRFILFLARRQTFKFFNEFSEWVEENKGNVCVKYARVHPSRWTEDFEDSWF